MSVPDFSALGSRSDLSRQHDTVLYSTSIFICVLSGLLDEDFHAQGKYGPHLQRAPRPKSIDPAIGVVMILYCICCETSDAVPEVAELLVKAGGDIYQPSLNACGR